jgi:hypothetical protein
VLIQGAIYDEALGLIRRALRDDVSGEGWTVESFLVRSRPHEPWHGLPIEQALPYFIVKCACLDSTAGRSRSRTSAAGGSYFPRRPHHLDLETGEETFVA